MTPPNDLELNGNFHAFPPAEMLTEIRQARLGGSLRLARGEQKIVVYFRAGQIIFAVSNARAARLFDILLRQKRIAANLLTECQSFANDQQFADFLQKKNIFSAEEIDQLFISQIENVLSEVVGWTSGEWNFSPLVRLRGEINFEINAEKILADYARRASTESVYQRFRSFEEVFLPAPSANSRLQLQPHEAFVFSRFSDAPMTFAEIKLIGGLPENALMQALYVLWLGGLLVRRDWNAAFSPKKLENIRAARISLVKEAATPRAAATQQPAAKAPVMPPLSPPFAESAPETSNEAPLPVEAFLERVENAENFYEVLGVDAKISLDEIKPVYFNLAKRFHPDHFHRDADQMLHRRVQHAFTQLAQAYDTLKTKETRETYDFKIRKELALKESLRGVTREEAKIIEQNDQATTNFENGFACLLDENYEDAVMYLGRAVNLSPETARFHAYYGKALSVLEKYRYKAETEIQTAIKLDSQSPVFRIMLVEFFLQYNLFKRAEGELNRLLTMFPNNKEALILLDSLPKK